MDNEMTRRERVMAALRGGQLDRVPIGFFGHEHEAERSIESNIAHLVRRSTNLGWDFLKVQLTFSYYAEAWGGTYRWDPRTSPVSGPEVVTPAVTQTRALAGLPVLDPTKGVLGQHVEMARQLKQALPGDMPYVQTVFCPLLVAGLLTGATARTAAMITGLRQLMREAPDVLHEALSRISQTLAAYARESVRAGADGVFVTNAPWSRDVLTEEEYRAYGRAYELPIFEAANEAGATLNIMHACRENIMLNLVSDYPIQIISYDSVSHRNPGLHETLLQTDKAVWAGLNRDTLLNGPAEAIRSEVLTALKQTGGVRFLLGANCSVSDQVPEAHFQVARSVLLEFGAPTGFHLW